MRIKKVESREVELIPEKLDEGVLYVSRRYATAVHKCCCGCGQEVVTPLSSRDWSVMPGNGGVRLSPSIGNWSYPCRSHYWIWDGRAVWAEQWSPERIDEGRARERAVREAYYAAQDRQQQSSQHLTGPGLLVRLWNAFVKWLSN